MKAQNIPRVVIPPDEIFTDMENHHALDPQEIEAMAHSIEAHGQLQAALVTDVPEEMKLKGAGDCKYLLIFGHLRLAGVKMCIEKMGTPGKHAGLWADYKPTMTMQEVLTLRAIENINRQDLTPIEESKAISLWLARTDSETVRRSIGLPDGHEVTEVERMAYIGGVLGKSRRWVHDRAFLSRLSPAASQALVAGKLDMDYAREISKVADHDVQDRILSGAVINEMGTRHRTLNQVAGEVSCAMHVLSGTPWEPDVPIDSQPACDTCPHNSANRPALFDGVAPKKPTCLSKRCFDKKTLFIERTIAKGIDDVRKAMKRKDPPALTATGLADLCPRVVRLPIFVRRAKAWIDVNNVDAPTPAATKAAAKANDDPDAGVPWQDRPDTVATNAVNDAVNEHKKKVVAAGQVAMKNPIASLALQMLAYTPAIRGVTEMYYAPESRAKQMQKKPWRDGMALIRKVMSGTDKQRMATAIELWKGVSKGMSWLQIFSDAYNIPYDVRMDLAKALGVELPPEPDYEKIQQEAHATQVAKLAKKKNAPQPDPAKRKPRPAKASKAKASAGRTAKKKR